MRRLFPSFGPRPAPPSPPSSPGLETKGATERRANSGGPYLSGGGTPYRTNWSPERAVEDGINRVVWVFTCINAIASDESRLPITWRQDHPETGDEIKPESEPLWHLLNRRANKYESAAAFRYRMSTQLLISKQGVFVELVRNKAKEICSLHLLPPHLTAPIPDPDTFVSGYEVRGAGGEIFILKPDQVLWIRRPHPLDPYMGIIPMESAGLAIDVDFYARMYNRNFMMNDGRPGGVLNVKGFLSQEDADELEGRFSGGPGRAGKVTVLESDGVEYVDTSSTARDMQHSDTRIATKKEILTAFGVPESRAGDTSGRTFDNADAEIEMYWRDTMRAHNDIIDSAFDSITAGGIDDDIFTVHDTTSVYVLSRDEKDKEGRFQSLWTAGLISADEFREGVGRDPFKRPGSRVLWVTNQAKIPVGKDADEQVINQQMGAGGAGAGGAPGADPNADPNAAPVDPNAPPAAAQPGNDPAAWGPNPDADKPDDWWNSPSQWDASSNGNGNGAAPANDSTSSWDSADTADPDPNWSVDQAIIGDTENEDDWSPDKAVVKRKSDPYLDADTDTDPDPDPVNTGIMVSLDVPGRVARTLLDTLLPPGTTADPEDPDDLHVTLSYLGKVADAPFPCDNVLEAVEHFAALAAPIVLAVSGIGHFSIPEGTATYASIDCPDLPDFHHQLVQVLAMKDVSSSSEHGFTPHVTLAYTSAGDPPPDIPIEELSAQLEALTFLVPEISVHWGDAVYRFPLHGEKRALASFGTSTYTSGE